MSRVKLTMPEKFSFQTEIPIRITDINYGGHVGNDSILSIIQESRTKFLDQLGYTELDLEGTGLIMSDVAIEFKSELFYGDSVIVSIAVQNFSKVAFEIYYLLEKKSTELKAKPVALAKTGMVCYDYKKKKVVPVPEKAITKLSRP